MTPEQVVAVLPDVVRTLATYDITTIRASVGMYLVCKAIHEQTGIKTLLTGEISDELFGYKYTDYAPSAAAFQQEAEKRLRELYAYDVLAPTAAWPPTAWKRGCRSATSTLCATSWPSTQAAS